MTDIVIFIIFVIFVTVFSSSDKKKKKAGKQPAPVKKVREQTKTERRQMARPAKETVQEPAQRLRQNVRSVTQAELAQAQEGEDPCHPVEEVSRFPDEYEQEDHVFGQDPRRELARAIIMHEILMRPDERRRLRENRM